MDSRAFVDVLKKVVEESSIEGVIQILENPPGRKPNPQMVKRSEWYKCLSIKDKEMVMQIVSEAVSHSMFGIFCVLDGVRVIEDAENRGELKLYYENNNSKILLNDPDKEYLHDIYKEEA
jgi:hypothetical protein